ncbi:hypothetical protein PVK06_011814 [Gossypium arboreum]|uniref:Uncharacterized protein n=1 Tax=Gossypium arboreum TaxID=29729 RepID=A0ABR0Q9W4_GOSAR|nr:hypothetical protein PVK06_011814 [Gossypium arboreum]
MDIDHEPVRGTRPLSEIYESADVATVEPTCFEEAQAQEGWRQAMLDEMSMIHKNKTWELVAKPAHKKVIALERIRWLDQKRVLRLVDWCFDHGSAGSIVPYQVCEHYN